MKRSGMIIWCIFILIFINVFTACTPPTPKSEDKERKTFSQMSSDEIEEAAEGAFVAHVRKSCNRQDGYFNGYDINDIRYSITNTSIKSSEKKAIIKGFISFYNDYNEMEKRYKFECDVVFEEDGSYSVPYGGLDFVY